MKRQPSTGHRAPHGVAPMEPPYAAAADPHPAQVAYLQDRARDWLVMWSPWRRAWTAIARFGAAPTVLDDPNPNELLRQCRQAEMAAAYGRPVSA